MSHLKILVSCPPMLGLIDQFISHAQDLGFKLVPANVTQTLSETELCRLLPQMDGWIIGDDPATRKVFEAGRQGRLRAAVKWGIGVDNVDFQACHDLQIPITNTPGMFGNEVADIALGYVIALARHTFEIDRGVRAGLWPKPSGISLSGRTVGLIGYGDIGRQTAVRLLAIGMKVIVYDPFISEKDLSPNILVETWPKGIEAADFVVVTCALTSSSYHIINETTLSNMKPGVRIVNVGRGPIIDQEALEKSLANGHVHSAALDVYEIEPLPDNSPLRDNPNCIFGSHNASNTIEGVKRTSIIALNLLSDFLTKSK